MIIGVNARFLVKPFTGVGKYTQQLFFELARANPDTEFILVTHEKPNNTVSHDMYKNLEIVILPEKMFGTTGMKKTFWEQVQVPAYLRKRGVDVLHFPYPSNPWRKFGKPVVVTVHDTIPWEDLAYRSGLLTRLYQNRSRNAVDNANAVLTVSQSSKNDLNGVCGVDNEKITVTYNALASGFGDEVEEKDREKIVQKYGIDADKPYFLYVGGYDERKNIDMVVKAFLSGIAPYYGVNLVLAGGKSLHDDLYKSFDNLTKLKSNTTLEAKKGDLMFTGFVTEKDLPALYQSSFAFLSLSKKEGFNLPLLEALTSGVPVIASDLPVHHEVAGDSAIYCQYSDSSCLITHMKKLLDDPAFYQKQKQKAEGALRPFSWRETAERVMTIYKMFL